MPRKSDAPSKLLLIDGANVVYRAFFAIPPLRTASGVPTNAALGFVNMLAKVVREEEPDAVVVVWDAPGPTFRHETYPDYKAGRDLMPEDLRAQIPLVRELVEAQGIPLVEVPGFEADDVIASYVAAAPEQTEVAIVSTDRDLMQLVSDRVTLLDGIRERRFDPEAVKERFGVEPERILDLRALVGDTSDNIPGVKGIGEKGAARLLEAWGTLERLLEHAGEVKGKRPREALLAHADDARLSKELSRLRTDVELPVAPEAARHPEPDTGALRRLYRELEFTRLLEGLEEDEDAGGPPASAAVEVALVRDAAGIDALCEELAKLPCVPLLAVLAPSAPLEAPVVGVAVARGEDRAAYLPCGADAPFEELAPRLAAVAASVAWTGPETKRTQVVFAECGNELPAPWFDAWLAGQLLGAGGARSLAAVASATLGMELRTWQDLAGRGAKARAASDLAVEDLAQWAGESVCAAWRLRAPLSRQLDAEGMAGLFENVELPLTRVLARMERTGIRVDEEVLRNLAAEYAAELERIQADVVRLAGEEFLISSPKQLQRILFEKLKLPVVKKTKTGYSTDEDVLEQLSVHHPLPERVLAHRRLSKLVNTYVAALPPLVNAGTGRIHPTFNQLGAATGRLSSTHPNVQNIPIRTPEGVRIREAFVAAEGHVLLSADYSQVELRIMAHYSGDETLIEAFRRGEDIHRRTAAEVAGIDLEEVTDDQRARAKAVNFGILYGSSAFGLSQQLGIAAGEAQETIDAYFDRYRGVRRFVDETIERAREQGHVTTLLGRRRELPDLRSRNRALRQAAERMAVNTVIQGTAADLIKKAMVDVDARIEAEELPARMCLQVHDELVFEVRRGEEARVGDRARETMEAVLALRVPLVVEVGSGANWREAH